MGENILVVTQDFPYPPNHGGRVDILNRIIALKNLGFNVFLVATVKNNISNDEISYLKQYCEHIIIVKRRLSKLLLFCITPYQVKSRSIKFNHIVDELDDIKFKAMIMEGHYVCSLGIQLAKQIDVKTILLRVQNDEIKYFKGLYNSKANIFSKMYYLLESIKFIIYEKTTFKNSNIDGFLHISYDEKVIYEKRYPKYSHIFLPASIDVNNIKSYKSKNSMNVLFIGSLFMPNNLEGLKWYLSKIHPKILEKHPTYKLIIAGNSSGVKKSDLENLLADNSVTLFESPDDLTKYYEQSTVFINPMLNGAGVKLKTINAICEGMPVISTLIGAEGTGLQAEVDILIATTEDEFSQLLSMLITDESLRRQLVENAQKFLKNNYNQGKILGEIVASR